MKFYMNNIMDEAFKALNEEDAVKKFGKDPKAAAWWRDPATSKDPMRAVPGFYTRAFGWHYIDLFDEVTDALSPINMDDMNIKDKARYTFLHCFENPAYDDADLSTAQSGDTKKGFDAIKINTDNPARAQEVAEAFGLECRPGIQEDVYFIDIPKDAPVMKQFVNIPKNMPGQDTEESLQDICLNCGKNPCECLNECNENALHEDFPASLDEFGIPYEDVEDSFLEKLQEDLEKSIPVQPLPRSEVYDFIMNIPAPTNTRPPKFFKCGYITEIKPQNIASKYRGGRDSTEDDPIVRIFKCSEYSQLMTGLTYRKTKHTKEADKELGTERHTGERTGFSYDATVEGEDYPRIGHYVNGEEAIQIMPTDACVQKDAYFISRNNGDLVRVDADKILQYLTPSAAKKVANGRERTVLATTDDGSVLTDTPIQRLKVAGIYMLGNRGTSIM